MLFITNTEHEFQKLVSAGTIKHYKIDDFGQLIIGFNDGAILVIEPIRLNSFDIFIKQAPRKIEE